MVPARASSRPWAIAAAVALLLVACAQPSPTLLQPTESDLGDRLAAAVSVTAIRADLATLQRIADANGETRADGTPGYAASVDFVEKTLHDLGYRVHLDTLSVPLFTEAGSGRLEIPGGATFETGRDFKAMLFSASGDITARVVPLGFERNASPSMFIDLPSGKGCSPGELPANVRGTILLVQPGPCFRRAQVLSAQRAGALAIVVSYPEWEPGFVLRPTLIQPDGISIPAVGTTREVGLALADAGSAWTSVHLRVQTSMVDRSVSSVIAETPGGDLSHVLMLGGHLDSALDSPGINDNGSGTMTLVEVARRLAALEAPRLKVRFAFWAGEELGFYGSRHYVMGLDQAQRQTIVAYLNFDMLGSPNGARIVYADRGAPSGSEQISTILTNYFDHLKLMHEMLDLGGGSDHFSFAQADIPTGGLFSGANMIKTDDEVRRFGGKAAELMDACYHRACDRADNVDSKLLLQMARAVAFTTGTLASGNVILYR